MSTPDETTSPDALTDYDRWREMPTDWGKWYLARARTIARVIPDGARVLDIGAGSMILTRYLSPGCIYQPCDLFRRSDDCLVADLNLGEFPRGRYDWVVMSGLLQYLNRPQWALEKAHDVASRGVFTYSPTVPNPPPEAIAHRKTLGWVNHLDIKAAPRMIRSAGWRITRVFYVHLNLIYVCDDDA